MNFPDRVDITNAVKYPQFIKDKFFATSNLVLKNDGRPKEWGGGFSMVYKMDGAHGSWALKVWHKEIPDNKSRYDIISKYLSKLKLPYFLDFHYFEKGLLVNENYLDILRIEWVEGLSLDEYISYNLQDAVILTQLADSFLQMIIALEKCSISHGDLQHDNIIVLSNGEIRLIDYDAVCVPELNEKIDFCRGFQGYQHPTRLAATPLITSTKVDHFSQLIVYLSICAVVENPLLWDKHRSQKDERLLFSDNDFRHWENSPLRKDLNLLSKNIRSLVAILDRYLASHIYLPSFFTLM